MRKTYKIEDTLVFVENGFIIGVQQINNDLTQRWAEENWGAFDETNEEWEIRCEGRALDWLVWDSEND